METVASHQSQQSKHKKGASEQGEANQRGRANRQSRASQQSKAAELSRTKQQSRVKAQGRTGQQHQQKQQQKQQQKANQAKASKPFSLSSAAAGALPPRGAWSSNQVWAKTQQDVHEDEDEHKDEHEDEHEQQNTDPNSLAEEDERNFAQNQHECDRAETCRERSRDQRVLGRSVSFQEDADDFSGYSNAGICANRSKGTNCSGNLGNARVGSAQAIGTGMDDSMGEFDIDDADLFLRMEKLAESHSLPKFQQRTPLAEC
jgi:hypothetical protein